jgi:hypothetical protein
MIEPLNPNRYLFLVSERQDGSAFQKAYTNRFLSVRG